MRSLAVPRRGDDGKRLEVIFFSCNFVTTVMVITLNLILSFCTHLCIISKERLRQVVLTKIPTYQSKFSQTNHRYCEPPEREKKGGALYDSRLR